MYLLLNTFQYFPHSLAKLSNCCLCLECANWRVYKYSFSVRSKANNAENTRRGQVIFCFNFFFGDKIALDLTLVLVPPTSSSIFSLLWVIKNLMGVPIKTLQNFFVFHSKGKDVMIKNLEFKKNFPWPMLFGIFFNFLKTKEWVFAPKKSLGEQGFWNFTLQDYPKSKLIYWVSI
jgi:hypothetical protein